MSNITKKKKQTLTKEVDKFNFQLSQTKKQLDSLEQYGRRENLEILGISKLKNDSTNQIIKTVAKSLNVCI